MKIFVRNILRNLWNSSDITQSMFGLNVIMKNLNLISGVLLLKSWLCVDVNAVRLFMILSRMIRGWEMRGNFNHVMSLPHTILQCDSCTS